MKKKKILFIYPSAYDEQGQIIRNHKSWYPSRTLPYLAALTPKRFDVQIIDDFVEDIDFESDANSPTKSKFGHFLGFYFY